VPCPSTPRRGRLRSSHVREGVEDEGPNPPSFLLLFSRQPRRGGRSLRRGGTPSRDPVKVMSIRSSSRRAAAGGRAAGRGWGPNRHYFYRICLPIPGRRRVSRLSARLRPKALGADVPIDITYTGFGRAVSLQAPAGRKRRAAGRHTKPQSCKSNVHWVVSPPCRWSVGSTPGMRGVRIDITFTGFGRRRRPHGSVSRNGRGAVSE
jgi:hypothetical protein